MLQRFDAPTKRILDLADYIEKSTEFNQGNWHHCICGHARRMMKASLADYGQSPTAHLAWACRTLGLDTDAAQELFSNDAKTPTKEDAARVLRHYVLTGQIDWTRGRHHWFWGWKDADAPA